METIKKAWTAGLISLPKNFGVLAASRKNDYRQKLRIPKNSIIQIAEGRKTILLSPTPPWPPARPGLEAG